MKYGWEFFSSLCCASCESSFCSFRAFESFEGEVAVDTILIALVMRLMLVNHLVAFMYLSHLCS